MYIIFQMNRIILRNSEQKDFKSIASYYIDDGDTNVTKQGRQHSHTSLNSKFQNINLAHRCS